MEMYKSLNKSGYFILEIQVSKGRKLKSRVILITIGILIILSTILASCANATSTATPSSQSGTPQQTTTLASQPATSVTTTTPPATTTVNTTNWWDKFGTPQYGGTLNIRLGQFDYSIWDPQDPRSGAYNLAYEPLFAYSWTTSPKVHPFQGEFVEPQYYEGLLATGWDQVDPTDIIVHIRQGVHYLDKPPLNGREFTADDVVYSWDRLLGNGDGFTQPIPFYAGLTPSIDHVEKVDKYTVKFVLKSPGYFALDQVLAGTSFVFSAMAPKELIDQKLQNNWKDVNGTGPWMVSNVQSNVVCTYTKNPAYWGTDERYPQNKVPYFDKLSFINIPDMSTAIAALTTGKVDIVADPRDHASYSQATSLKKNDPDIQQFYWPQAGPSIEMRVDTKPFNDIKVRQALEMSIDRAAIAKSHYGGLVDGTPCGLESPLDKGWVTPYSQWPADLQAIYSYNPDQAKTLLSQAGCPNGFNTDIVASTTDDIELLQIIQSEFKDVGVNMAIKTYDMPTEMGITHSGKFDAMVYGGTSGELNGPIIDMASRTTAQEKNNNDTFNSDSKYDALYQAIVNAPDLASAQKATIAADMYDIQQCWSVNTFDIVVPELFAPNLEGYSGQAIDARLDYMYARLWKSQ